MGNKVSPLNSTVPIVDTQGRPTPQFMQAWGQQAAQNKDIAPPIAEGSQVSDLLNLIGKTSGSVLVRNDDSWVTLPSPGNAKTFLSGSKQPAYTQVHDADIAFTDVTTGDVSADKHGYAPKLPGDAKKYFDGAGKWSTPAGGGGDGGGGSGGGGSVIQPLIIQSKAQSNAGTNANSPGEVTFSQVPKAGNLLVVIGGRWAADISLADGWTFLYNQGSGSEDIGFACCRVAPSNAAATQQFSSNSTSWSVAAFEVSGVTKADIALSKGAGSVDTTAGDFTVPIPAGLPDLSVAVGCFLAIGSGAASSLTIDITGADSVGSGASTGGSGGQRAAWGFTNTKLKTSNTVVGNYSESVSRGYGVVVLTGRKIPYSFEEYFQVTTANPPAPVSSSSAAAKGNVIQVNKDISVTDVVTYIGPDTGASYKLVVATVDPTKGSVVPVMDVLFESPSQTTAPNSMNKFEITTDLKLAKGSHVGFILVRTDGSATSVCQVPFPYDVSTSPVYFTDLRLAFGLREEVKDITTGTSLGKFSESSVGMGIFYVPD